MNDCTELLASVPLCRLTFVLSTDGPFGPRGDHAADVRGALGKALHGSRAYDELFEPQLRPGREPRDLVGGSGAPRPFVLRPPSPFRLGKDGGEVVVTAHLFHPSHRAATALWDAMRTAVADGFGRPRASFELIEFHAMEDGNVLQFAASRWSEIANGRTDARVDLHTITPVCVRSEGRLLAPSPPAVVHGVLRRAQALADLYGEGAPVVDFGPVIDRAMEIEQAHDYEERFESARGRRRSHSQQRRIPMVGALGGFRATVPRDVGLLLLAAEALHVGKSTTSGMGWIGIEGSKT